MKVLDLFSGIGGFSLGLERAGFSTVAFCEIEDYPVSKLNKHWPSIPVHRDIRKLDGKQYRNSVDVVCGGFPCQPFSVAGKQRGKEDDRHLWPEMLRVIKEVRPTWVIGENVAGFIRMALDDVLLDLETEGYATQSFVVPACAIGAVHRRDRVWIVGYAEHAGRNGSENRQGNSKRIHSVEDWKEEISESAGPGCEGSVDANSDNAGLQGSQTSGNAKSKGEEAVKQPSRLHNFARQEFEPIGIPTQPPVCHRDDGVSDRVARLKALGNSVCPQIPELIGRAIMEAKKCR